MVPQPIPRPTWRLRPPGKFLLEGPLLTPVPAFRSHPFGRTISGNQRTRKSSDKSSDKSNDKRRAHSAPASLDHFRAIILSASDFIRWAFVQACCW